MLIISYLYSFDVLSHLIPTHSFGEICFCDCKFTGMQMFALMMFCKRVTSALMSVDFLSNHDHLKITTVPQKHSSIACAWRRSFWPPLYDLWIIHEAVYYPFNIAMHEWKKPSSFCFSPKPTHSFINQFLRAVAVCVFIFLSDLEIESVWSLKQGFKYTH